VRSFGDIHGGVGSLKQSFGIGPISRKDCDSHTDVDLDRAGTDHDRLLKTVGHSSSHSPAFLFGGIREQDRELVAPKPRDRIAISRDHGESPRYLLQHFITYRLAEGVVDVLELVEIEHENDKLLVPTPGPLECVIEALAKEHPIRQVR
jgi:hypothetical protein